MPPPWRCQMPSTEFWQPYQERPKNYPLQFVLHFDPATDADKLFPLLMTTADTVAERQPPRWGPACKASIANSRRSTAAPRALLRTIFRQHLSIDTPDEKLNQAFSWAEVAIDQLRVANHALACRDRFGRRLLHLRGFGPAGLRLVFWPRCPVDALRREQLRRLSSSRGTN